MNRAEENCLNRSSNLELLRILCIVAIIAGHFVGQSGVLSSATLQESFFYSVLLSLPRVSCSVFVIISAWFLVDSPFKVKRIFRTWLTVIMYTVPFVLAARFIFHIAVGKEMLYQMLFPIEESPLWFAGYYIVLVAVSPLLNILLRQLKKTSLETALYVPFIFIVLYSTAAFWAGAVFTSDLWIMIYLYLLTGYFKKYSVTFGRKKCLAVFLFAEILLCSVKALTSFYAGLNLPFFEKLAKYAEYYRGNLQTLPNIVMAYTLFFLFRDLKMRRSRLINTLAGASLGVYCMHQIPVFYDYMWKNIFQSKKYAGQGVRTQIYTIAVILVVWLGGTAVELFRKKLAGILVESRGWYKNLCSVIDQIVNSQEQDRDISEDYLRKIKRAGVLLFISYFLAVKLLTSFYAWSQSLSANDPLENSQMALVLEADVHYNDGSVQGTVTVRNEGNRIMDLSSGTYPVRIGVSLVDADGKITDREFHRLEIADDIKEGEEVRIPVRIDGMEEYRETGGGLRFAIVQEKVSWREDTAVFYWFEDH